MRKIGYSCFVLVCVTVLFCGLTVNGAQAKDVKKWRMSVATSSEDPMTLYAKDIAKRIKEKSDGGIEITVFDSMKLGHERETIEQMQAHALEMSIHCAGALAIFWEGLNIYSLPYMFTSMEQGAAFEASAEAEELRSMFEKKAGLKILGYHPSFFMHIMNSKRPIDKPYSCHSSRDQSQPGSGQKRASLQVSSSPCWLLHCGSQPLSRPNAR